ncbi:MAG: hypothetical protein JRD69_09330 [Deltaproteobacteria bacterium]|nr:hypothetical protein [Deltaproteobacteria bacterium]
MTSLISLIVDVNIYLGTDYCSVSVRRKRFQTMAEQDKEDKKLVTRIQEILIQK